MAYITTGLTNGGVTTHYRFSYDQALGGPGGPEPARTNAVIAACESDYNLMSGWFGGGISVTGMNVQVTTQSNGASWSGSSTSSTIQLKAQGASYSNNPAYLRYLIVAEVVEIFMMTQGTGWFQGSNEGSKGEGLSRFLSSQFLAQRGFLGVGIDASYAVADLWLNSPRADFVNNAPDDNGYNATNGCTTLFIYYLFSQLRYSINQIVGAGSSTLAGVYGKLTGKNDNPFPLFKSVLDLWFPSQTSSAVPGPNFDDPFPLLPVAYTGVWRGGTAPYYLWTDADESHFLSKWSQLAGQNLRLTDIDVCTVNGQRLWSGIWEGGNDAYYLWIDADTSHFLAKWTELAQQNLRLVSIKQYDGLWAGVWRHGSDGYYLWIDADESHFLAKWSQLTAQNLRLIDFDVYTSNGQTLWAGVWREGTDGYYLWIDASWNNFVAKWSQLAQQNLRLVGARTYNGLWAGIWRSGSDPYYLWAGVSEGNFLARWNELAGQNLRLIDVITTPLAGVGGAASALPASTAELAATRGTAELIAERAATEVPTGVAASEMRGRESDFDLALAEVADMAVLVNGAGHGGGAADGGFVLALEPASNLEANGTGGGSVDTESPAASIGHGGGAQDLGIMLTATGGDTGRGGGSASAAAPVAESAMPTEVSGTGHGGGLPEATTPLVASSEMVGRDLGSTTC